MKATFRSIALFSLLMLAFTGAQAQAMPRGIADPSGLELKIQSSDGTNGSAVAWNPILRKYYAVIAGNASYPLETFDFDGKPLASVEAGVDVRGLWWNPANNSLECNEYGNMENSISYSMWYIFSLSSGLPTGSSQAIFDNGSIAPSEQSIGTFYAAKNCVAYYHDGVIFTVSRAGGKPGKQIKLKGMPCRASDINSNVLLYTGIKGYEFGVLDYEVGNVLLFNAKGAFTAKVNLPETATVNYSFNASYANGQLWLYNTDSRIWTGYKIFR